MILDTLFPSLTRRAAAEGFPRPADDDDYWYGAGPGAISTAGIPMTEQAALAVSAQFACTRVIAETCASLPLIYYERTGERTKRRATDHAHYTLLHDRPNRWQTSFEFREMKFAHLVLRGNFFARIVLARPGEVGELVPLHPDRMRVEQLSTGRLRFHYRPPNSGVPEVYTQDEIHYVRGLSLDGVTGVSTLTYARNALGLAAAQETHGAALFKNGSIPPYFLTQTAKMSSDARKEFRKNWRGLHGGAENAHNPPVFDNGMEAKPLGVTNEDSQWLESRKFQAEEIARFNRMQPHKIGLLDKATFSNIEHQAIEFVVDTIRPWLVRDEQAIQRDLVDDPDRYFAEYLVDGLLRGDTLARYNAYAIAIKATFMKPNEAREKENWNPIEGGDEFPEPPGVTGKGAGKEEGGEGEEEGEEEGGEGRGARDEQRAAFGLLLEDAAARIVAAEARGLCGRADRAAEDRDRWNAWAATFFHGQRQYVAKTLKPIAQAWLQASGRQIDVEAWARESCIASLADCLAAEDVPSMAASWIERNLKTETEALKRSFFDERTETPSA